MKNHFQNTINLPRKDLINLLETMDLFESIKDEIENFLISNNKEIMKKVKKSRREHLAGKLGDFEKLAEKYV